MISTGSAPMSPAALDFLKVGMNADVMEGALVFLSLLLLEPR